MPVYGGKAPTDTHYAKAKDIQKGIDALSGDIPKDHPAARANKILILTCNLYPLLDAGGSAASAYGASPAICAYSGAKTPPPDAPPCNVSRLCPNTL
jgi:hypothetical protein